MTLLGFCWCQGQGLARLVGHIRTCGTWDISGLMELSRTYQGSWDLVGHVRTYGTWWDVSGLGRTYQELRDLVGHPGTWLDLPGITGLGGTYWDWVGHIETWRDLPGHAVLPGFAGLMQLNGACGDTLALLLTNIPSSAFEDKTQSTNQEWGHRFRFTYIFT